MTKIATTLINKKLVITSFIVIMIISCFAGSVSASVHGDLTFYHGVNYTYEYTYGKTASTAYENSMQFIGLIHYMSGPLSGETYGYESTKKYYTTYHSQNIYPGNVSAESYFIYFVDNICQHQSTAWWFFDFR